MTVCGKIIASSLTLGILVLITGMLYCHSNATQELAEIDANTLCVQWHLKNFNYARYCIHRTPNGIFTEGVVRKSSLPFTELTSYVWNLEDTALTERCKTVFSRRTCNKISDQEIQELRSLLARGRSISMILKLPEQFAPNQKKLPVINHQRRKQ